ncbi:Multidrug efflux pump subunit AcrB [Geosporobacter subterraneus DSM 17957]|uniref:Multidrug efflux pump subunit AcrB n=1 Tax=Geosporobacter subterraneus DSM 17957 TaxID=1121919 RepID=A0A1M6PMB7_9FIRM|nr:efflux RND transporter permease subunit [Geosporobacter subterraneus]SHK09071.1 Multidrug efflux pump subunit AcrB [Geosporobacter subterraneus DSM 17957]
MGKGLIAGAIKERKVTLFIALLTMIAGIYSYYITPKQENPQITASIAIVTAVYPGASPEDVEKLVTRKIEDEAAELKGYDYSESHSRNGLSIVVVRLTQDANIEKSWTDLRQKMEDLQSELPKEVHPLQINTDLTETAGIIISMSGENYSYEQLEEYGQRFKKELSKINGISRFDIHGKQEKEVSIEVDISQLNQYQLSLQDIIHILQAQNISIPLGQIKNDESRLNVTTSGTYADLKEIENTILIGSKNAGAGVRLKDIAKISMDLEEANYRIKQNGRNAILLTGYFQENKNIVIIGKSVEKRMDELKKDLPEDIYFDQVLYQPKDVSKAVNNFILNLITGIMFVIMVVFIGMGFRNAVIVSTAIPLSILSTFVMMKLLAIPIHQVSITALIIALGMLVDNAIVVSDSIQVKIDQEIDTMQACVEGVREVAIPVLSSTLTTVAAFTPLLMLPSMAGEYIQSLPLIIMISLWASYMVALLVTPTMAYLFFRKSTPKEKQHKIRTIFDHMLHLGMSKKRGTVFLAISVFVLSLLLVTQLGLQFFPKADTDILYIDIRTESGANIRKTEALTEQVTSILKEQKEIISYTTAIGDGLPKFYNTLPIYTQSQDFAQIMIKVDLKNEKRFKSNTEFADYLQEIFDTRIAGGTATIKQLEQGEPIGAPVRVRVTGDDMEKLEAATRVVSHYLSTIPGTINIDDDFTDKAYEFYVDIDAEKASFLGITKYDIQNELNIALMGRTASIFRNAGNEYNIVLRSYAPSQEVLENLMIKSSATGNKILLKEIAEIQLRPQIPNIKKHDREKAVTIYSDVKSGFSSVDIQRQLQQGLEALDLEDVQIVFDGEREKIQEHFGSIGTFAVFALLLVYGILLIQFNSFIQPFIILLTIPLSVIGSIVGLYVFRQPLSFTGLLGMVSLLGIVVNNAIVLLDFINGERKLGKGIEESCLEAVDKRFRPIVLSTTTTVIGLTPLVFSGSDLFRPMSISLMSGLMVSTLLTLVVIPVVYSMVESMIERIKLKRLA